MMEVMRTTVDLPEPLLQNAKALAAAGNRTLSAVVEDALRRHLAVAKKGEAPAFRLHTVSGRLKDPGLDLDRTSALDIRDDEAEYGRSRRAR
jgi:hypothetical protein